ncbi:hypothetical protein GCM10027035_24390 [Emticicia sediminis]
MNVTANKNSNTINLSPSGGIFVAKNTEIGFSLNIIAFHSLYNTEKSYLTGDLSSYIIRYFGQDRLQPYLLGEYFWDKKNIKVGAGLQYLIIPSVGAFLGVSYRGGSIPELNLSSGFAIYITRKKHLKTK